MGFLESLFGKRATKVTQAEGNLSLWPGDQAASGIHVDQENAFQVMAVKSAVTRISEFLATLPLKLYRRVGDRGKEEARDHPLFRLIGKQPNPLTTSYQWRETAQIQTLLWGNHISQLVRDRVGRIIAVVPLVAGQTEIQVDGKNLVYIYTRPDGQMRKFRPDQVFHMSWFAFNGFAGEDPISQARDSFGLSLGLQQYASDYLANEAAPSGVLQMKGRLRNDDARQRLKDDWRRKQGRWGKKQGVAVLEEGLEWKSTANTPRDSQLIEERKYQVSEVARWYNIPPHLIADLEHATFTNVEEQSREFITFTMMPWLVRWEQSLDSQLLSEAEQDEFFFKFSVQALLRGDAQSRAEYYAKARNWGWMSADDIRELEDMNPLPEGIGETYWQPVNMAESAAPGEGQQPGDNDDQDEDPFDAFREERQQRADQRRSFALSMVDIFEDAWRRVVVREEQDIAKAARKMLDTRDRNSFEQFLSNFYREHGEFIRQRTGPLYQSLFQNARAMLIGDTGTQMNDDELTRFIDNYFDNLIAGYTLGSTGQLRSVMDRAQEFDTSPRDAVLTRLSEWTERRPGKMAREETLRGVNAFTLVSFQDSQMVRSVRWVAFGDNCPFCKEMNGRIIPVGTEFVPGGDEVQADQATMRTYRNVRHPPLHQGCDCQIVPA